MLKMSLKPDLARPFINIIGELVDEFRLRISKEGWKVVAVDPANVALIDIDLPKENFETWEFDAETWTSSIDGHATGVLEEEIAVGIGVTMIKEFIDDDGVYYHPHRVHIEAVRMLPDEQGPVEFTFSLSDKYPGYQLELKQGMFSRKIKLLPEERIRKSPKKLNLSLDYALQFNTLEFIRIMKKAKKISDYIRLGFKREEGSVTFTAIAGDEDPFEVTKQLHGWNALRDGARDSASSMFSLDYLCDIAGVIPSEKVYLHLGQDNLCELLFVLGQTGQCEYKQAPRVESE